MRHGHGSFCGAKNMMLEKHLFKILELPKHLQTTVLTLLRLGRATASEVASVTGKSRAVESAYLNQLAVMRVVSKFRCSRKAVFQVVVEGFDW
jgi:ArsR family transcriptional regulator, lead/cadmium/zinc/bismuth-responsive transcriptional repressor